MRNEIRISDETSSKQRDEHPSIPSVPPEPPPPEAMVILCDMYQSQSALISKEQTHLTIGEQECSLTREGSLYQLNETQVVPLPWFANVTARELKSDRSPIIHEEKVDTSVELETREKLYALRYKLEKLPLRVNHEVTISLKGKIPICFTSQGYMVTCLRVMPTPKTVVKVTLTPEAATRIDLVEQCELMEPERGDEVKRSRVRKVEKYAACQMERESIEGTRYEIIIPFDLPPDDFRLFRQEGGALLRLHFLGQKLNSMVPCKQRLCSWEQGCQLDARKEPEITVKEIDLSESKNEWVRVAMAQLDYCLEITRDPLVPYKLREGEEIKKKVFSAVDIALKEEANIICFPEFCCDKSWVGEIKEISKDKDIIAICGTYYENAYNKCPIVINGEDFIYRKISPSPLEKSFLRRGNHVYAFNTKYGAFSVLVCSDINSFSQLRTQLRKVKYLINPCYDPNVLRAQQMANSCALDYGAFVVQVNRKEYVERKGDGKTILEYGKSCIIAKENDRFLELLMDSGNKPKDDIRYKLCEAQGEALIVANVSMENPESPIRLDYGGRTANVKKYRWEEENWKEI